MTICFLSESGTCPLPFFIVLCVLHHPLAMLLVCLQLNSTQLNSTQLNSTLAMLTRTHPLASMHAPALARMHALTLARMHARALARAHAPTLARLMSTLPSARVQAVAVVS